MLSINPDFVASEMFIFQYLSGSISPEGLLKLVLETPSDTQSTEGITPGLPSSYVPGPLDPPPQVVAPVNDGTRVCVVCSTLTSLPPSTPSPQAATLYPPNWHKIQQTVYDYGQNQLFFTRSGYISFGVNGRPGVNMRDAIRKRLAGLIGGDDLVLQGASTVISCRLSVRLL